MKLAPIKLIGMKLAPLSIPRAWTLAAIFALGSSVGCVAETEIGDEAVSASTDDITGNMNQSTVKRQSIGNCWVYAVASWTEALSKRASGKDLNSSESYMTYWHWFEQLANGGTTEISTGGSFRTAMSLYARYGLMTEADFITNEANAEMSGRQASALAAINTSLKSGVLKDPAARRSRAKVRAELDRAWGLSADRIAKLDTVFGKDVSRTLDRAYTTKAPGNGVLRASDIAVATPDAKTKKTVQTTLADVANISTGAKNAFTTAYYPSDAAGRRAFQQRLQRAMHDGAPVLVSWFVDFNALTTSAQFSKAKLDKEGPGHQGRHMTVFDDYEAVLAGGRTLKAGVPAAAADLELALRNDTKVSFFRIKNSWGAFRPDRWLEASKAGYHDLDINYLNGPVKECQEVNGATDPTKCTGTVTPLSSVQLPAGY